MKKIVFLCLTLMAATLGFAQQQLATLNHNDSITVYYGASALQQAHAAAVNGDIITLSPGAFNSVNITKAVTIRGAGMSIDTVSGTNPTVILNDITLNVANDSVYHLTLEGLQFAGEYTRCKSVYRPQFIKCHFRTFRSNDSTDRMVSAQFINCIIPKCTLYPNSTILSPTFINSVIIYTYDLFKANPTFVNSIANISSEYVHNVFAVNSILFCNNHYDHSANAYSSFNTIGINIGRNYGRTYNYYDTEGTSGHNVHNFTSYEEVFKNFRGTYTEGITFELQDSIAQNILGNDSTQVGIYGGTMPFDPRVSGLNIRRLNVANRTTADGKLPVDIEVVSDEAANNDENE